MSERVREHSVSVGEIMSASGLVKVISVSKNGSPISETVPAKLESTLPACESVSDKIEAR